MLTDIDWTADQSGKNWYPYNIETLDSLFMVYFLYLGLSVDYMSIKISYFWLNFYCELSISMIL